MFQRQNNVSKVDAENLEFSAGYLRVLVMTGLPFRQKSVIPRTETFKEAVSEFAFGVQIRGRKRIFVPLHSPEQAAEVFLSFFAIGSNQHMRNGITKVCADKQMPALPVTKQRTSRAGFQIWEVQYRPLYVFAISATAAATAAAPGDDTAASSTAFAAGTAAPFGGSISGVIGSGLFRLLLPERFLIQFTA